MAAPEREPLRVICGPTAAGKSAIVMQLAERFPLTVISADSRQIYRRFDVGTGKPGADERARVPHSGVDIIEPVERYSAAHWAGDAARWIDDAVTARRVPVVVGGTGFYVRALVQPLFEEPELDGERRRSIQDFLGALSTDELRRWSHALDAERRAPGRTQMLRVIEVALLTGERLSLLHAGRARAPELAARYLLVDAGASSVRRQIEKRVSGMFDAGWMDEVRQLDREVPEDAPAWLATGYEAVRAATRGELSEQEARDAVYVRTRQYAKRQRTWFRNQLVDENVTRLDPTAPDALDQAIRWWNE